MDHFNKDELVLNKLRVYDAVLKSSVGNCEEYLYIDKNHKCFWCSGASYKGHCYNSCMNYESIRPKKKSYDSFKNFRFRKDYDKIKYKSELWFNIKNADAVDISGSYTIEMCDGFLLYLPTEKYSLKLNDIPVSYLIGRLVNKNLLKYNKLCIKLYFTFDLSTYCDMIDYVLKSYKYKYIFFGWLPLEIIEYILWLTSIF
jgi:hypothetical protein